MSTTSDFKVQIEKLDGPDDWPKWKWQILMLRAHCLEGITDGSRKCPVMPAGADSAEKGTEWRQDDAKAASIIAGTLSKSVAELVLACTSAKDVWDKLCARFECTSTQRLNMRNRSSKQNVIARISARMLQSCKNFVDLNDELAKHNENTLSERMLTRRILSTLGKEYDNFKDVWNTIPTSIQTVNLPIVKLCAIELRADKLASAEATAIIAHENYKKSNSMKVNSGKSMKSGADRAKQISLQQVQTWSLGCGVSSKAAACREQKW